MCQIRILVAEKGIEPKSSRYERDVLSTTQLCFLQTNSLTTNWSSAKSHFLRNIFPPHMVSPLAPGHPRTSCKERTTEQRLYDQRPGTMGKLHDPLPPAQQHPAPQRSTQRHTATPSPTPQHPTPHRNTQRHTAAPSPTPQHPSPHRSTQCTCPFGTKFHH